jgi:4-phosphopantoate--beta-alanine ligase
VDQDEEGFKFFIKPSKVMIPKTHPRYESLIVREKLVEGVKKGITSLQGLIAHGRGEMFDYVLGEKSHDFALESERTAVALMLISERPIISVNGNTAVLVPEELKELSELVNAPLEVNVFHFSLERVRKIKDFLEGFGVRVLAGCDAELRGLDHARRIVDKNGIYVADTVLVPLEDGDRCEILRRHGKRVIAIDLNPLSRTSRSADVSIIDNVTRAIPNMVRFAKELRDLENEELLKIVESYDNSEILRRAIETIRDNLTKIADDI